MRAHGETARVIGLPAVTRDFYRGALAHLRLDPGEGKLWDAQACAIACLAIFGGGAFQLGCGDGKTLVGALGAVAVGAQRPLVLIPGKLRDDYFAQWSEYQRLGFRLPTNLEVKAHDFVSRHSRWLDDYAPDYIYVDEAHAYRRPEAARTRRLLRYLEANPTRPNGGRVTFGVASGTLASTSVLDFAHLLTHAMGPNAPLPRRLTAAELPSQLAAWANCLDVDGRPDPHDWNTLAPLVEAWAPEWADVMKRGDTRQKRHAVREAYDARRRTVPAMITSDSESVSASLIVETTDEPAPPAQILESLRMVRQGYSPDGDEAFEDDVSQWRAGQQVSIGVFYRWAWERTQLGRRDDDWIEARKRWNRAVRHELADHAAPDYDSPGLIYRAVEADLVRVIRHGARPQLEHLHAPFIAWYRLKDRYNVDELREHVWLDPWYVEHVVADAVDQTEPTIVWYESSAMEGALRSAGLPTFGAGDSAPSRPITCALSRRRFGTGANLQDRWSRMHFAEFPSSGEAAEQVLARLHRPGQRAAEVVARVYTHTQPFRDNLERARAKARFISKVQGRQRLSYCPFVSV